MDVPWENVRQYHCTENEAESACKPEKLSTFTYFHPMHNFDRNLRIIKILMIYCFSIECIPNFHISKHLKNTWCPSVTHSLTFSLTIPSRFHFVSQLVHLMSFLPF